MEKLSQFGLDPLLLLAQVVNFLLLLYLLKRFLYKPILEILKRREVKIKEGLEAAKEGEELLVKAREEEKEVLLKATDEAGSLMEETKKRVSELEEKALSKANKESAELLIEARKKIEVEKKNLAKELEKGVVETSIALLKTILPKILTREHHLRILDSSREMLKKALP